MAGRNLFPAESLIAEVMLWQEVYKLNYRVRVLIGWGAIENSIGVLYSYYVSAFVPRVFVGRIARS